MKFAVACLCFLLLASTSVAAQENYLEKLRTVDLAQVIYPDSISDDTGEMIRHSEPLGYIGENYQRFRIHFTLIRKSKRDPFLYDVKGKTRVKGNICSFTGTLKITSAEKNESDFVDVPGSSNISKYTFLSVISDIELYEDKQQNGSGIIRGSMLTDIFFDERGKPHYDALMLVADGYSNNQFTGTWTGYKTGVSKKCNWGDYRIPESRGLDIGAGEFSVDDEYVNNGWQSYRKAYCCGSNAEREAALKEEEARWWQ